MCGIHVCISEQSIPDLSCSQREHLLQRGPDHLQTVNTTVDQDGTEVNIALTASVLALRGDRLAKQPFFNKANGSVLCWNGEAWRIAGQTVVGNDAEAVFKLLLDASSESTEAAVLDALRSIEGPFAFVYLDKPARKLFYGRDRLGRRSLLLKRGDPFLLASVADVAGETWSEVDADGCYVFGLSHREEPQRHSWRDELGVVSSIGCFNASHPDASSKLTRSSASVLQLQRHLHASLCLRLLGIPIPSGAGNHVARVAVLFSGGLDCSVLARMAADTVLADQAIELINVAFENPRIASQYHEAERPDLYELCPDRITGRRSFKELLVTCPSREWRFVTVNVPFALLLEHRTKVIELIYPHNTEMDLSIAYALYFASRGVGLLSTSTSPEPAPYTSTARVLLSGLGADELFGGYQRHSLAFTRRGWSGLAAELELDVGRLGKRNLGRDDRVMSSWQREVRFPYLDERFVQWAMGLPMWEKCDFDNAEDEEGIAPDKRILRLLAAKLGMSGVAKEKKRAIQFGARTAKMESGRTKGTTLIS